MSKIWVLLEHDRGEDLPKIRLIGKKENAHKAAKARLMELLKDVARFDQDAVGKLAAIRKALTEGHVGLALSRWNGLLTAPVNLTLTAQEVEP